MRLLYIQESNKNALKYSQPFIYKSKELDTLAILSSIEENNSGL